ncbi:hypothetical protein [Mycobacterium sp. AZCC_0083]|uniref:hypothetical protein n=1 Tax=Mycobacterium sp. AZCC_0083 TaxID=2735882 RepID=UPI00160FD5A5|nr:hypothetical protein [Mycobacterium sp. AZCC_0083]MBB5162572.1 hypothetical protein [Mycobacterium sp. AZCC_0083]
MTTLRVLAATAFVASAAAASPPIATAEPAGFPDLNAFTDAPANLHFSRPVRWASGYTFFRTPDGLNCIMGSVTRCTGSLPGLPPSQYGARATVLQTYEEETRSLPFRFEAASEDCGPTTDDPPGVGQKLTFTTNYTTTCVVGEGRLTACIQNDHGFVLQPSGSWVF